MPIDFVCPKCRADLETPDGSEGAVTHCPTCGAALVVPGSPPALPVPPPAEPESVGPTVEFIPASPPVADDASLSADRARSSQTLTNLDQEPELPLRGWWVERLTVADDPFLGDVYQVARPAPRRFSTSGAIGFGARLMQRHLVTFSWANLAVVAFLATTALLTLASRLWPYVWIALLAWLLFAGPPAASGAAALSLRAARGRSVSLAYIFPPRGRAICVWTYFIAWVIVMFAAVSPPFAMSFVAWQGGGKVAAVGLMLVALLWTMFVGARLGWFPFVFHEQPQLRFGELLAASVAVGRGRTFELMRLSVLAFAALAGTNVAIVVVGLPLAMSVAGAAYVLLARDAVWSSREG